MAALSDAEDAAAEAALMNVADVEAEELEGLQSVEDELHDQMAAATGARLEDLSDDSRPTNDTELDADLASGDAL